MRLDKGAEDKTPASDSCQGEISPKDFFEYITENGEIRKKLLFGLLCLPYSDDTRQKRIIRLIFHLDEKYSQFDKHELLELASINNHIEIVEHCLQDKDFILESDSNILAKAANQNNIEIVGLLLDDSRINPTETMFIDAIYSENVDIIGLLLDDKRVDPSFQNNSAIVKSCVQGCKKIVELLLNDKRVDPSDKDNEATRLASLYCYTEILRLLLKDKRVDPSDQDNVAIKVASANGYLEIVKLLTEDSRINISAESNKAIKLASANGHLEVIEFLLSSNLSHFGLNEALKEAALFGHDKIVKLFLQDRRFDPTFDSNNLIRNVNGIKSDSLVT